MNRKTKTKINTKTIKQRVIFKANPHEVYELLMDSKKHAEFTGAEAKISRKVGGKFSAYDGYITGINLELIKNKKIVQAWTCTDWPKGHYSKATFSLIKVKDGTKLTFTQSEVPESNYKEINQG